MSVPGATEGYLTAEEIKTFHSQGYFIKKGCLSLEQIKVLDQLTSQVIQKIADEVYGDTYSCGAQQQVTHMSGSQVVFKKPAAREMSILRVVGCGGIEPQFLQTLRSHKMAMTFFELLGCMQLEHLICQMHPKQPNDGVKFDKHRDIQYRKLFDPQWQDVLGNGSYAIAFVAIDPMSSKNGGLVVDKKSYPNPSEEQEAVPLTMDPGDILFMHPEILHWSAENTSDTSRRALLTGYCAWGANHRNYPGTEINKHLTLTGREITIEDSGRSEKPASQGVGNH